MISLGDILSNPNKLFSVRDVARVLGICDSTVWNWISYKQLNSTKVGNTWVFRGQDIIDYLEKQQTGGFKTEKSLLLNHRLPYERK